MFQSAALVAISLVVLKLNDAIEKVGSALESIVLSSPLRMSRKYKAGRMMALDHMCTVLFEMRWRMQPVTIHEGIDIITSTPGTRTRIGIPNLRKDSVKGHWGRTLVDTALILRRSACE